MTIGFKLWQRRLPLACLLGAVALSQAGDVEAADTTLTVGRFFGPCPDAGTNVERAHGEACIIQAILNAFHARDNGVKITMRPANWDRYYEQLLESYAEGDPPDVHILHRHRLASFIDEGLLAPLDEDLANAGIDVDDWAAPARQAVTIDDRIYGVPLDIHANLWHINLDLLAEAGLVGLDGRPILPKSPGELLEHAKRVKETTGKAYLAADFVQFPIGVRAVLSLLWQQDATILEDGDITLDTPEMRAAVTTMTDLFEGGYATPQYNYEEAQQAFLNAEVAILINGTWAVEFYDREASNIETSLADYDVADFPTLFGKPATWGDAHLWVVPADLRNREPETFEAAMDLLGWINEHNSDWARTGHLAVRNAVLESKAFTTLPHRLDYRQSGEITYDLPPLQSYDAIQNALMRQLQAVWNGEKTLDDALTDAEAEIDVLSMFR